MSLPVKPWGAQPCLIWGQDSMGEEDFHRQVSPFPAVHGTSNPLGTAQCLC